MSDQQVVVIGLGYIGLPTAAILATHGKDVIGVDVSDKHVDAVNRGEVPFVEPDLAAHVSRAVADGLLRAQKDTPEGDVYIIAVPTPFKGNYEPDLKYVDQATDAIIPNLKGGELIVLESTSPPGSTKHVAERVAAARPDLVSNGEIRVEFAHCPERVLPGRVMIELVDNDRIIGGLTEQAALRAKELYATFCRAELHLTDATTAEMAKLTENAFRDVNIAFANELSIISDQLGIDVFELIELANKHPRVNILQPGPGVGGHCIAVDPWFIVDAAPEASRLIRAARDINDGKPEFVLARLADAVRGMDRPKIAVLGLAFKPDIDDLRESPALSIAQRVAERYPDAESLVVEPNVDSLPRELQGRENVRLTSLQDALAEADAVLLLVDHKEFRDLPAELRPTVPLIDTRGAWR